MSIRRDGKSLQQNWQWLELGAIQKQNYHNLNSFFEIRNNFLKRKHLRISKRQQQYQNAKQNEQKWKRRQTQNIRKYFLFLTFLLSKCSILWTRKYWHFNVKNQNNLILSHKFTKWRIPFNDLRSQRTTHSDGVSDFLCVWVWGGNQYLPIDCELIYLLTIYIY